MKHNQMTSEINYKEELDVMMPTLTSPLDGAIVQQLAAQLEDVDKEVFVAIFFTPWGHHQVIIDKCKTIDAAIFYLKKSVQQGWSRKQLQQEIVQNLYARQGKAITNFEWTLPHPESALAVETLKNPYNFDFLRLGAEARERDIEEAMMRHIEKVRIDTLPDSLKGILPTTEELERELDENLNSEKHRKNQARP